MTVGGDTYYPEILSCGQVGHCPPLAHGRLHVGARRDVKTYVVYANVVPKTTKLLTRSSLARVVRLDGGGATIVFHGHSPGGIAVGTVLVAGPSRWLRFGLLRKVTSVAKQGPDTVVDTKPATLLEAVPRGSFYVSQVARAAHARASASGDNPPTTNYQFGLAPGIPVSCGGATGLSAAASASVSPPSFTFAASWGWGSAPTVEIQGSIGAQASVSLTALQALGCSLNLPIPAFGSPFPYVGYLLPQIGFFLGPVPIVIQPELLGTLSLSGSISEKETVGASVSANLTAGISYANGSITPSFQLTQSFQGLPVSVSNPVDFSAQFGPRLYLDLYGNRFLACSPGPSELCESAVAPYVDLVGGPDVAIQPSSEPWWTLDGKIAADVGLHISALDLDLSESFPLFDALLVAPPLRPVNVAATAGDHSARVSWQPPPSESCWVSCGPLTGYTVYVNGAPAMSTAPTTTTATLTGLTDGQSYQIAVAASSAVGQGARSAAVQVIPVAPPPVTATGWTAPMKTGLNGLNSLSCVSSTFCVAVGGASEASVYRGSSWATPMKVPGMGALRSVSCASPSFCAALSYEHVSIFNGFTWSAATSIVGYGTTESISCVPTGGGFSSPTAFCAVAGTESLDLAGYALTGDGHSWSAPTDLGGINSGWVTSCSSPSFCEAVGASSWSYNGKSWSSTGGVGPVSFSVSCPSSSFCAAVAVGDAATFNGSAWNAPVKLIENPSLSDFLLSVSCATESFCLAGDSEGKVRTYNGASWASPITIDTSELSSLWGMSCASGLPVFCVAGDREGNALIYAP